MPETLIALADVSYTYPDGMNALEAVDLEVSKGECVAIAGPNGAGKSTLLQLVAGLIPASGGSVRLFGEEITPAKVEHPRKLEWLRRRLGIVFQDSDVALFNSTVWNDVIFGPLHMGIPPDEVRRRGEAALADMGISHLRDRAPYRLSRGEKRKASIASVLSMEPEVILFDEPTSDLDPRSRIAVIDLLGRLSRQGRTVIVATHDVNAVPDFAGRIVVLKRRVIGSGKVREVLSDEVLLDEADLAVPEIARFFKVLSSLGYHTEELPFSMDEAVERIIRRGDRFHIHQEPH